ncbi:tafazzin [Planococcus citri]|uniref:tafazzin n=1 Tax=Planococcus citri TaxID=170843 RepID=UPI0031F77AFD
MDYNIDWIIPALRKPTIPRFLWRICSSITVTAVGCLSKLFIRFLNKPKIYNTEPLHHALQKRPLSVPLITVSNHHSCFDDPGIWVMLKWRTLLCNRRLRWSLTAHDICFTNSFHSYFFMSGQCIPVVRGKGVFQEAVDYCVELLARGEWLHVFPEGKVNMTKEFLRLKWGIGRIIYECPVIPIVIPIWHVGMEEILPNYPPYYLRTGKKVTINVGDPIDLKDILLKLKEDKVSDETARKVITDRIQNELYKLKEATEELHKNHNS